ncbi:MAG: hypothetical protein VCC67_15220 [Myxococcota bacterium]
MQDNELKNLVDEFLYLVEVGSGSTVADESELAHLLDRLALAMRQRLAPEEPDELPEIPERNFEVLRKVAASRFPNYGAYNRPARLTEDIGDSELEVASAIDDVAIVADHLHVVAWLWRNASGEAGLWYLEESRRDDWGHAMRALQLYLQVREAEREREEVP